MCKAFWEGCILIDFKLMTCLLGKAGSGIRIRTKLLWICRLTFADQHKMYFGLKQIMVTALKWKYNVTVRIQKLWKSFSFREKEILLWSLPIFKRIFFCLFAFQSDRKIICQIWMFKSTLSLTRQNILKMIWTLCTDHTQLLFFSQVCPKGGIPAN